MGPMGRLNLRPLMAPHDHGLHARPQPLTRCRPPSLLPSTYCYPHYAGMRATVDMALHLTLGWPGP